MNLRHLAVVALAAATAATAQQPFQLDTEFRTQFNMNSINGISDIGDILERPDGKIIISGSFNPPNSDPTSFYGGGLLKPNGAWIPLPAGTPLSDWYFLLGGKMVPWGDKLYVGGIFGGTSRLWMDGRRDTTYQNPPDPLIHSGGGGDFHVFSDGRVLLTGNWWLADTARGFVGTGYGLVWTNSDGSLDTTRTHRYIGPGSTINRIRALADGRFICGGRLLQFEGEPVPSIVYRVLPDGAMDTTFHGPVTTYGYVDYFLEQPDGKVLMTGNFCFEGSPDTLGLVRLLPDGQLDPLFNNVHQYRATYRWGQVVGSRQVHAIGEDLFAVTGDFDRIDGEVHGGIAMLDSVGNVLPGYFEGAGCGGFFPGPAAQIPNQFMVGVQPAQDGGYFIYGSYHGYDDGTTNDTSQRLLSKLYGFNVGIHEQYNGLVVPLQIAPNPSSGMVQFSVHTAPMNESLTIHDPSGRMVLQVPWPGGAYTQTLQAGVLAPGTYIVRVASSGSAPASTSTLYTGKLIILP